MFKSILLGVAPILLYFGVLLFTSDHQYIIVIFLSLTYLYTVAVFRYSAHSPSDSMYLMLVLPFLILMVGTSLFATFIVSWPYVVLFPWVIWLGRSNAKRFQVLNLVATLSFIAFVGLFVFPNVFILHVSEDAHERSPAPRFVLTDSEGDTLVLDTSKLIVLDFWNTGCGSCYRTLPAFEQEFKKNSKDTNILFYTINVPNQEEDLDRTKALYDKLGYSVPLAFVSDQEARLLGITTFPQLLIISNGQTYFKGPFYSGWNQVVYRLDREVKRALSSLKKR